MILIQEKYFMHENTFYFYIREVFESELGKCAEIIRKSFATVAGQFHITQENLPNHRAFIQTERLIWDKNQGVMQFGLFIKNDGGDILAGFAALEKVSGDVYEFHMLSVPPEYRHNGFGAAIIEFKFIKAKVRELNGKKIEIDLIEENIVLKNWYLSNGFVHTGTKAIPNVPFIIGYMEVEV